MKFLSTPIIKYSQNELAATKQNLTVTRVIYWRQEHLIQQHMSGSNDDIVIGISYTCGQASMQTLIHLPGV